MQYLIEYYWPDGSQGPDDQAPYPHLMVVDSMAEARVLIRNAGAGRYGQWVPDAPHIVGYHESRRLGCGGFTIRPV